MKKLIFTLAITSTSVFAQMPTNGLIASYPFNGNANDESGNGNIGTVNGATLTTDRFGKANSAYSFDGVSSYIQTLILGPTGNTSRAFSFWVKTGQLFSNAQNEGQDIICYGTSVSGGVNEISLNHSCEGLL
jgi:hypothetical protein